jgi:hypothetical protein
MILNNIYLLKNSLIGSGNLSKRGGGRVYEALSPKFNGVYKIFLLHTSWYQDKFVLVSGTFGTLFLEPWGGAGAGHCNRMKIGPADTGMGCCHIRTVPVVAPNCIAVSNQVKECAHC